MLREMRIESIRVSMLNYQRVVILKEKDSDRYLPIWIGPAEADAIAMKLQGIVTPRPMTHDLLTSIIHALGAHVNFIVVNDLKEDTFYAKIVLEADGRIIEVDSRPSDAMALAVRVGVPIYVEEDVLERAGITIDRETKKPKVSEDLSEEELKKLSAFKDVIESLDLDDFEKK